VSERPALGALAERFGILPGYLPAGGGPWRATADGTRVALLAALGVDASDEARASATLEELDAEDRRRLLDPAAVLEEGRGGRVRVALAAGDTGARYALEVEAEQGGTLHTRRGRLPAGPGRAWLRLPALLPGRHHLRLRVRRSDGMREAGQTLLVGPGRCLSVEEKLGGRRAFGIWTNLYALRSERGLGVGDLSHLRALVELSARAGADFVGVNPLHALDNRPPDVSPYAPLSRLFRNPIYLDTVALAELAPCPGTARRLAEGTAEVAALRRAPQVDYARTARLQDEILRPLHARFAALHREAETERGQGYRAFRQREGPLLRDFATFLALTEHFGQRGLPRDWRAWPPPLQDPGADEVRTFREAHRERVDFHAWVQFELEGQLAGCAEAARRGGLGLGLYQDLAVGSAASGFDVWALRDLFVSDVRVGAPPDDYNAAGQDWGFPPVDPQHLARDGYRYWERLLRCGFLHAGALRIDHVMGLFRQWWIPAGAPPEAGAYVRFPSEDLLGVLARESRRSGALVVGEDLGTVPRGLPAVLARRRILSSRVLLFERSRRGGFRAARRYSRRALATANTHDLPTLAGWWWGRDLELERELGILPDDAALETARRRREAERRALLRRLARDGALCDAGAPEGPGALAAAVHRFLCATPAPLVGLSLDDLAGELEPVNLPGVAPERHPSWTRRMALAFERFESDPGFARALGGAAARRRPE
jgi:4-alpha-glucanotransferase